MAKEVATAKKTELTTADPEMEEMLHADAGRGVSTLASDNLVPLVYVLQPLSPQVMDGPAHIENAHAGDIWLKNASMPIVPGKTGIWFMPSRMYLKWTEWVPRDSGGGFVSSYEYTGYSNLPTGAKRDEKEKSRPRFYFPETGNELIETRYEAGYIWRDGEPMPYVIPFKSTGHSVSRAWMTKRTNQKRADGTIWPAWTHLYKLTTSVKKNNYGQWYIFDVGDPLFYIPGYRKPYEEGLKLVGGDYRRAYQLGKELDAAFETGQKREDEEEYAEEVAGTANETNSKVDDEIPF
jgi:hypothetical protein